MKENQNSLLNEDAKESLKKATESLEALDSIGKPLQLTKQLTDELFSISRTLEEIELEFSKLANGNANLVKNCLATSNSALILNSGSLQLLLEKAYSIEEKINLLDLKNNLNISIVAKPIK